MPKNSNTLAALGILLALLGILWTAAERWGRMEMRVEHLEETQRFLHGDIKVPGSK